MVAERPLQLFTRWYGFALTFPHTEIYETAHMSANSTWPDRTAVVWQCYREHQPQRQGYAPSISTPSLDSSINSMNRCQDSQLVLRL